MSSNAQSLQVFQNTLFIKNFRNVSELSLTFGPGHNLFIGPNGHGKTNCLEAIAISCSLKPMQALHNIDLIKFEAPQAKILANFAGSLSLAVDIDILPHGKKAKLNAHALKASSQLVNFCPLVSFIPAELNLISGAHALRRRALDQAALALFAEHALALRAYEKLLENRNRLLKDWPQDVETLATFTELLIKEGAQVMYYRLKAIEHIHQLFSDTLKQILGQDHHGSIAYHAHHHEIRDYAVSDLLALLDRTKDLVRPLEHKRRVTMFGPHLDDMMFFINGVDARSFASRGQTRALVFSFKLSQMMAIHRVRGLAPIVILDDIVSELDQAIKANLMAAIAELKTQAFFSTTDLETFGSLLRLDRIFSMSHGIVV